MTLWQEMSDLLLDEDVGLAFPATWKRGDSEWPVTLLPGILDDEAAFPRARVAKNARVVKMAIPTDFTPTRDDKAIIDGVEWTMRESPTQNARGTRLIVRLVR